MSEPRRDRPTAPEAQPHDAPEAHHPHDAPEARRKRRGRNIALALVLAALVVLFYVITLVRMGQMESP